MIDFQDFTFGTATASHQIEGDNRFNQWWEAEKRGRLKYRSGRACEHWKRYEKDIELMAELGYDSYRFSIEWSRIFPKEKEKNNNALDRYQDIIDLLNERGIMPMVTLHHFTNPTWFMEKGGFLKDKNIRYWRDYVETIRDEISGVDIFCTINEPMVYIMNSYLTGEWPPFKTSLLKSAKAEKNLIKAHDAAYGILKGKNKAVGIVKHFPDIRPKTDKKKDIKAADKADDLFNWNFLDGLWDGKVKTPLKSYSVPESDTDFIGLNYYTLHEASHSWNPFKMFFETDLVKNGELTLMGWTVHPEGIYRGIKEIHDRYDRPLYITENGIATHDDRWRVEYILKHLIQIHKAREEGYDVRGYMYWSFMDNFEWAEGFEPRFGLIGIDFKTCERKVRKSAKVYGKIAKEKGISADIVKEYIKD